MKRILTLILFIFCVLQSPVISWAQDIQVNGKVTSKSDGLPLPGVTVTVEGAKVGTSTGTAGTFSILVPRLGSVLVFQQLGMLTQRYTVESRSDVAIQIVLTESTSALDEIVVVGYGIQKKSVVTGAISSIKASDLESQPINRIEQALQGRTSGLTIAQTSGQPGAAATVRLRGLTSFGNDKNNPLWVIDGVLVDNGGIGYLNQSDIESIEVLKDAASAAIYGARAAAGVIIVTTKKGKSGAMTLSYNGYYGTSAPAKKLDLLNASEYAALRNEASGTNLFPNPSSLGEGTNWQDQIFNDNAGRQNHELSISGGGEKSNFYSSFGFTQQDGIVTSEISKWKRANIRLNSTHKVFNWISVGQNLGYSNSRSSGIGDTNREFGGPLSSAINLTPIMPVIITDPAVANATPYNQTGIWRDTNGNPYAIPPGGFQEMTNPLAWMNPRKGDFSWDHNIVGNVFVDAEPVKGLVIRSSLGAKLAFWGNDDFSPISYLAATQVNGRTQFNRQLNYGRSINIENTISYTRLLGNHSVTLLAGQGNYDDGFSRGLNTTYYGIPAVDFYSANLRFRPAADADRVANATEGTDHKVFSLFSRLTYNYKEKYLASVLVRRDGSSRFGENNKYGTFPSFTAGWVPTLEEFFPQNSVLNFLKIRGSYGVTGNDVIGDFGYVALVSSGNNNGGRNYSFGNGSLNVGTAPVGLSNPDLKWEETTQTNIGFDATLFNNLTFTADWYIKKTTGILQTPPVPSYLGTGGAPANVADMKNTGLEFELGYRKRFGEINFGLNANASFVKNEVTKLLPKILYITSDNASFQTIGGITRTALGRSQNEFYGFKKLGIFQSQAEIDNYKGADGTVLQPLAKPGDIKFAKFTSTGAIDPSSDADKVYLGNSLPKMVYGLTLNLGYKNFDLVAFGAGQGGNMIFQGLRRLDVPAANYRTTILDRWTPTNPSTTTPRVTDADPNKNYSRMSDHYLEKGDFFRLRTLQLGYTLPKSVTSKVGSRNLRLYVLAENLFTLTEYTGYDPELGVNSNAGSGSVFSVDRGFYPQARSFIVGVNLGF